MARLHAWNQFAHPAHDRSRGLGGNLLRNNRRQQGFETGFADSWPGVTDQFESALQVIVLCRQCLQMTPDFCLVHEMPTITL